MKKLWIVLCFSASLVFADVPYLTYNADFRNPVPQFHIRTAQNNTPLLRFYTFQGTSVWSGVGHTFTLKYSTNAYSIAMATVTGSVSSGYVDFQLGSNNLSQPMEGWYCVVTASSNNSQYSYAQGQITARRAPEFSATIPLDVGSVLNGSLFTSFAGSFTHWPFVMTNNPAYLASITNILNGGSSGTTGQVSVVGRVATVTFPAGQDLSAYSTSNQQATVTANAISALNLGSASTNESDDFYLASNPSGYISTYAETDPEWSGVSNLYYLASNPSSYVTASVTNAHAQLNGVSAHGLGTISTRASNDFYLASNPSGYGVGDVVKANYNVFTSSNRFEGDLLLGTNVIKGTLEHPDVVVSGFGTIGVDGVYSYIGDRYDNENGMWITRSSSNMGGTWVGYWVMETTYAAWYKQVEAVVLATPDLVTTWELVDTGALPFGTVIATNTESGVPLINVTSATLEGVFKVTNNASNSTEIVNYQTMTNHTSAYLPLAGGTLTGVAKSTVDYTTSSPANDDIALAGWVRSLAMSGEEWFFTSSVSNFGGVKTTNFVALSLTNPTDAFTNTTASVGANQYIAGGISTQLYGEIRSPISFEMYLNRVGGNATTVIPVHPELYYIYNGTTNHLGDWETANQNVTATTPLRFMFTVAFPEPMITGAVHVVGYLKSGTPTGTAGGLAIVGGGAYPSHMDIEGVTQADVDKVYNMANMTNWAGSVVDGNFNMGGNSVTNALSYSFGNTSGATNMTFKPVAYTLNSTNYYGMEYTVYTNASNIATTRYPIVTLP